MDTHTTAQAAPAPRREHDFVTQLGAKAGDLLPLFDFAALALVALLCRYAYPGLFASAAPPVDVWHGLQDLAWIACLMAPFMLYDRHFAESAAFATRLALARRHARRLALFVAVVTGIAYAGRWLHDAPGGLLAFWIATAAAFTTLNRYALAHGLRRSAAVPAPTSAEALTPANPERSIRAVSLTLVGDCYPVTLLADRPIRRWNAVLKAGSDYVLGGLITVMLLPVLGAVALAIRLDSPGPILFRQRRHGCNNVEFDIYKFRSMRVPSDIGDGSLQQTIRGDSRITPVGHFIRKWSLDELPQVFNVLQGHMSLVGPRPHAVNMRTDHQLGQEIVASYPHRHRVKPGITGWAQVNGARGATDTPAQLRRRIELDLHYVDHWSLLFDMKVLVKTFSAVLRPTNAF